MRWPTSFCGMRPPVRRRTSHRGLPRTFSRGCSNSRRRSPLPTSSRSGFRYSCLARRYCQVRWHRCYPAPARTRPVVGLTAAIDDLADLVGRLLIRVVRLVPNLACLLTQLASKFRTRLRREEHSKTCAEHRAREQSHQERTATVFPFEAIIFVRHAPSCFAVSNTGRRPAAVCVRCVRLRTPAARGHHGH